MLITNVIGEERIDHTPPVRSVTDDPQVDELWRVLDQLAEHQEPRVLVEAWHDLLQAVSELQDRFVLGLSSISARATLPSASSTSSVTSRLRSGFGTGRRWRKKRSMGQSRLPKCGTEPSVKT